MKHYEVVKVYSFHDQVIVAKFETRNEAERCREALLKAINREFDIEIMTIDSRKVFQKFRHIEDKNHETERAM